MCFSDLETIKNYKKEIEIESKKASMLSVKLQRKIEKIKIFNEEQEKFSQDMSLPGEIWMPCYSRGELLPYYEVSNLGRVRRRQISKPTYTLLNGEVDWNGYSKKLMTLNGKSFKRYTHHLVLESFGFPRPSKDYETNHIDGNKLNNRLENLEWCTGEENRLHANMYIVPQRLRRGSKCSHSVINESDVLIIREKLRYGLSCKEISIELGIRYQIIYNIKTGKSWKHVP